MKVQGAVNKYMFWTLTPEGFGEFRASFEPFKEKSKQKAAGALSKAGVKVRSTVGTYQNKLRLFPAHIKIPG